MQKDFTYHQRKSWTVNVGNTTIGGGENIRIQSMTNTDTNDIAASLEQSIALADAGAELVRLTAQGTREAASIGVMREQFHAKGYDVPLVADIHFKPQAAFAAAEVTDKVRINPGNFVDPGRTFKKLTYTDEEYAQEIEKIGRTLRPFIALCREKHRAVRIGVNHGSLSDRIMSRYGDTPMGMVESAMEFLRVFVEEKFLDVVISIKTSNTVVMVETVRRLVKAMEQEKMYFPLHLGVTEAGDGEDGRIKSAVGIGTLLSEGIGDTIRVSLSEDPVVEIPVAKKLADYALSRRGSEQIKAFVPDYYDYIQPVRRRSTAVCGIGGANAPVVVADKVDADLCTTATTDWIYEEGVGMKSSALGITAPIINFKDLDSAPTDVPVAFMRLDAECYQAMDEDSRADLIKALMSHRNIVIILSTTHKNIPASLQAVAWGLAEQGVSAPIILHVEYGDVDTEQLQVMAGLDLGSALLNGIRDGIWITQRLPQGSTSKPIVNYSFALLQSARLRMSKTEFISCPSCGRTLFDLQKTVKEIKEVTSHLTHLKIGIMGCIVNGPGEMADADYGYVGAGVGKVSLYKNKECVERNIPQEQAISHLIDLIKRCGDWKDPE